MFRKAKIKRGYSKENAVNLSSFLRSSWCVTMQRWGLWKNMTPSSLHVIHGQAWATSVSMKNQSILKVICWDLSLAGIDDAIVSEELVLNKQHHRTLTFSLKNTSYTNNSKTWWEIDTVDVLNSPFLIYLFFFFIHIVFLLQFLVYFCDSGDWIQCLGHAT